VTISSSDINIDPQEAIRRSEQRYRELWHRNLAGGFRAALDGRILDCNDSFARLFGINSRADMLTRSTRELYFDPGVREEFLARLREHQILTNYEMEMRRADGTPIWVLENVQLLNENGQEILEGTIIDITARKHAEQALRASENNYRTLINQLDQAIFLKDRELRYVTVNPVFCAAMGMTEDDLRGKTIREAFPPNPIAEKSAAIERKVLEEGRSIETEEVFKIVGVTRNVRVSRTPVKDSSGAIVGVLGICWDVTAQRELEMQLRHVQKMDAIGQLAGGVAHDFNNLLTIMLGNLSYILTGTLDQQATLDLVRNVEHAGMRAAALTQTLLSFSRRSTVATEPYNLNQAIEEVVRLTRSTLPETIALEVCADPSLWLVQADPTQIHQILTNLTLNARDAMPRGGKITYETGHFTPSAEYLASHVEARPGEYVRLRVKDAGAGIPPEVRQRIFEPFFTTKDKGKGTGLGLAIVFSIVKQHNGWIDCESVPGKGTTFDVFLPRCEATDPPREAPAAPAPASRMTILLVDDEAMIRQLTKTILGKAGYDVLLAENGEKAIEIFQEQKDKIALVILDSVMPQLSGRETLRELARLAPNVNVLFSSGFSTELSALNEYPQVRGLLPKPYRAEQLVQKVIDILGQRTA
jgi:two-component system, cell cycle sensor histidine kinase and response regulator CckA